MNMEPESVSQELPKGDDERYLYSVDTVVDILRSLYVEESASSETVIVNLTTCDSEGLPHRVASLRPLRVALIRS